MIDQRKLEHYLDHNYNVLLIGEAGCGKTEVVKSLMTRKNINWIYFSGSTLDPWTDFIGIPREQVDPNGKKYIEYIKPKRMTEDIEVIVCDEFNRCITGDTNVQLVDGYSVPIKELVGKEKFYVYSFDIENQKVAIGKGHSAKLIGKNERILKITLDTGQTIRCTPDHKFLLSNSTYIEAQNLKIHDSLMCLFKQYNHPAGYEQIFTTRSRGQYTHHLSDEYNILNGKYTKDRGNHRHHIDENRYNNNPENITRLTAGEHSRTHMKIESSSKGGKIAHMKHPDLLQRTLYTQASRIKAKKERKKFLENAANRQRIGKSISQAWNLNPDRKIEQSNKAKEQWKNGQFKNIDRQAANIKAYFSRHINILRQYTNDQPINSEQYIQIMERHNKEIFHPSRKLFSLNKIEKYFGSLDNLINYYNTFVRTGNNHKVVKIEEDGYEDVYCLTIEKYHNFATGTGVFIHNCHQKVANALMELIQFKTINGEKFPKLRAVWAMINPYDDEGTYNVSKLDRAQLDRFHIHIHVPYDIDRDYFSAKYGKQGELACEWWDNLTEPIKHKVSPRRVDYALDIYRHNGDLRDVLPEESNVTKLIMTLNKGSIRDQLEEVIRNGKNKEWINNENNYTAAIDFILKETRYKNEFIPYIKPEKLTSLISEKTDVLKYVCENYFQNHNINNTVDRLVFSADKTLRDKIYKTIDSSIPGPETINLSLFNKKPIIAKLGNNYTKLATISTFKSSEDRGKCLNDIANSLSHNMTSDDYKDLINQLNLYCSMTHYKTILKYTHPFMCCLNHIAAHYNWDWLKLFKEYPKIYTRVYGANLWEYCKC